MRYIRGICRDTFNRLSTMYSVLVCWFFLCLCTFTFQNGCSVVDYYWRDFNFGCIPYDAVEIANDGKYIAQVYIEGGIVPATIYPHLGQAVVELFGRKIVKEHIKILCSPDQSRLYWDELDFDKPADDQMKNAIVAGFYKTDFNVFIGRAYHDGQWKVGKIIPIENQWKGLRIWNADGATVRLMKFDMLKYNSTICF